MSPRPLISALAIFTFTALVLAPGFLLVAAGHVVRSEPCVADGQVGTSSAEPGDAFYRALRLLEITAGFPGFAGIAADTSTRATTLCTRSLRQGCRKLRDAAMEDALVALRAEGYRMSQPEEEFDWWLLHLDEDADRLCDSWSPWMSWLETRSVDPLDLCPVCQPLPAHAQGTPLPATDEYAAEPSPPEEVPASESELCADLETQNEDGSC